MQLKKITELTVGYRTHHNTDGGGFVLFEEMAVDFELLFEHDFAPVLNNECIRVKVPRCPQNLPVLLHTCHSADLQLGHMIQRERERFSHFNLRHLENKGLQPSGHAHLRQFISMYKQNLL